MPTRARLLALVFLTCVVSISSAAAGGQEQSLKVTSTIDGKKVLPLRSRWIAHPSLPESRVREIAFLIDGKLRWIERFAPYNYGSDDLHGHLGYLFTTWLAPGEHAFTARVTDTRGRRAIDTVVARVLPAPEPPTALKGMWGRVVTEKDLTKSDPKFGSGPPAGTWKLVFDRVGAWHLDPQGTGVVNQYNAQPSVIHVYAPIQMAPLINNHTTTRGYGAEIGGHDCREDGPFGSYNWSVSGKELTLRAIHEGCGQRRAIWEGVWTRVG
jgi:hypothetical protein